MEPMDVEQMFEPFAQSDHSLARTKGGLGLGLALVKSIVELHGGPVATGLRGSHFRRSRRCPGPSYSFAGGGSGGRGDMIPSDHIVSCQPEITASR
jgi:hypothetical protein